MRAIFALILFLFCTSCTVTATLSDIGTSVYQTIDERASVNTNIPYRSHTIQIENGSDYWVLMVKDMNAITPAVITSAFREGGCIPPHSFAAVNLYDWGRAGGQYAVSAVAVNPDGSVIGSIGDVVYVDGRYKQASIWKLYNCSFARTSCSHATHRVFIISS